MKWLPQFFTRKADGGKKSGVTGYMLIEWKGVFSIGLLHFKPGSREDFHSHAFNAVTWWLRGNVIEIHADGRKLWFSPSFKPKYTSRKCFHKIYANVDTWALTFRGPWQDTWKELRSGNEVTLTHGRKLV